jgi:hypothetical protein
MAAKVTLETWARLQFDPPPCRETLRRWARSLRIYPEPEKIGRTYYVDRNARYVHPRRPETLSSRIGGS